MLRLPKGEIPSGYISTLELLALLVGLRCWHTLLRQSRVQVGMGAPVEAKSDSKTALAALAKGRSSGSFRMNLVLRELVLWAALDGVELGERAHLPLELKRPVLFMPL